MDPRSPAGSQRGAHRPAESSSPRFPRSSASPHHPHPHPGKDHARLGADRTGLLVASRLSTGSSQQRTAHPSRYTPRGRGTTRRVTLSPGIPLRTCEYVLACWVRDRAGGSVARSRLPAMVSGHGSLDASTRSNGGWRHNSQATAAHCRWSSTSKGSWAGLRLPPPSNKTTPDSEDGALRLGQAPIGRRPTHPTATTRPKGPRQQQPTTTTRGANRNDRRRKAAEDQRPLAAGLSRMGCQSAGGNWEKRAAFPDEDPSPARKAGPGRARRSSPLGRHGVGGMPSAPPRDARAAPRRRDPRNQKTPAAGAAARTVVVPSGRCRSPTTREPKTEAERPSPRSTTTRPNFLSRSPPPW
jgi:hypothetical protein